MPLPIQPFYFWDLSRLLLISCFLNDELNDRPSDLPLGDFYLRVRVSFFNIKLSLPLHRIGPRDLRTIPFFPQVSKGRGGTLRMTHRSTTPVVPSQCPTLCLLKFHLAGPSTRLPSTLIQDLLVIGVTVVSTLVSPILSFRRTVVSSTYLWVRSDVVLVSDSGFLTHSP